MKSTRVESFVFFFRCNINIYCSCSIFLKIIFEHLNIFAIFWHIFIFEATSVDISTHLRVEACVFGVKRSKRHFVYRSFCLLAFWNKMAAIFMTKSPLKWSYFAATRLLFDNLWPIWNNLLANISRHGNSMTPLMSTLQKARNNTAFKSLDNNSLKLLEFFEIIPPNLF